MGYAARGRGGQPGAMGAPGCGAAHGGNRRRRALGWLITHWAWLLATPVVLLGLGSIGLLDPIAIYLDKRHHELWIAGDTYSVRVFKANSVEARKALRAIQRACEHFQERTYG